MKTFFDEYKESLEAYTEMSRAIGARNDYVQGGGGNTSAKLNARLMAIKASGYCLSDISPDAAYAVLDYAALRAFYRDNTPDGFENVEAAGAERTKAAIQSVEGMPSLRPSVEAGFHAILDRFVIHSHSVYANLCTCSREMQQIAAQAFSDADYAYGTVPYTDPGSKLAFIIQGELERVLKAEGKRPSVILMQNHGIIVHGEDAGECVRLHADANKRLAGVFGLRGDDFPQPAVSEQADGVFASATPYLQAHLKGGAYPDEALISAPLYPDQLVFLGDALGNTACICRGNGTVQYRMSRSHAQVIEETLTAIVFITETIRQNGYTLSVLGENEKSVIANWESEKYRKQLAKDRA